MKGFSPKFPLEKGNSVGAYILNTTFKDMIKQNFKNLLLTNQGERVMDIKFNIYRVCFRRDIMMREQNGF